MFFQRKQKHELKHGRYRLKAVLLHCFNKNNAHRDKTHIM